MRRRIALFLLLVIALPLVAAASQDWLVKGVNDPVTINVIDSGNTLSISNGLIERTFRLHPNLATISLRHQVTEDEFVRGVKPEAQVVINGATYEIGGLKGQPNYAYLEDDWIDELTASPDAFQFKGYSTGDCVPPLKWKQKRYAGETNWPPKGKHLTLNFQAPENQPELQGVEISVHYEQYQGIPVLSKWVEIQNNADADVTIDSLTVEILAVVERISEVNLARSTKPRQYQNHIDPNDLALITHSRFHPQSDYMFCGMSYLSADQTNFWEPDPEYLTQVNYDRTWPHLFTSRYPYGPGATIAKGETFTSFRVIELLQDSDDKERRGLAIRKMHRVLTPWVTENPIMLHLRYSDSESIRKAVDQCAEVGFEMIILSFGSGINMENIDSEYIARFKADFDYAHSKGIEIGAYSLLSSRSAGPENDVIDPKTGKPGAYFGNAPCLMSEWGDKYFRNLKTFIEETGCDLLEHDGSYPGDPCASTVHPGHKGLADSQWAQHKRIVDFYEWCRAEGVYLNVPDFYVFNGSNKIAMGYRETNWSLPREQQVIHSRQHVYDGTFLKPPSMGWMFVPLVEYHGGGAAATLEPLKDHLDTYETFLWQNFGAGVQACYRGPRIYDAPETKEVVKRSVDFYKKYRDILDSDIIHLHRPDGRNIDGILHVNPKLKNKGFAMLFNPTTKTVKRTYTLPLYYAGVKGKVKVSEKEGKWKTYSLNENHEIEVPIEIEPRGMTWFAIQ